MIDFDIIIISYLYIHISRYISTNDDTCAYKTAARLRGSGQLRRGGRAAQVGQKQRCLSFPGCRVERMKHNLTRFDFMIFHA